MTAMSPVHGKPKGMQPTISSKTYYNNKYGALFGQQYQEIKM